VPTGAKTPDDGSYSDLFDEFIHPFGNSWLMLEGFYVNMQNWDWQTLNTKLHSRFGDSDIVCDVDEIPTAIDHIQKWIGKNPLERQVARTWLDILMALNPAKTVDAAEGNIIYLT
jgi:hypothetical protein